MMVRVTVGDGNLRDAVAVFNRHTVHIVARFPMPAGSRKANRKAKDKLGITYREW